MPNNKCDRQEYEHLLGRSTIIADGHSLGAVAVGRRKDRIMPDRIGDRVGPALSGGRTINREVRAVLVGNLVIEPLRANH